MTIRKVVITDGTGETPDDGNIVGVRYTAYKRTIRKQHLEQEVYDEEEIDSSVSFGSPDGALYVTVGSTSLLDELNETIRTMHVGETCDIFFARHDNDSSSSSSSSVSADLHHSQTTTNTTTGTSTVTSSPTRNTHMRFRIELLSSQKSGKLTNNHSVSFPANNATDGDTSTSSSTSSSSSISSDTSAPHSSSSVTTINTPTKSTAINSTTDNELPVFNFYNEALRHKESGNKLLGESSKQSGIKGTQSIKEAISAYRQGVACITEYERKTKQEKNPSHTNEECQQLRVIIQSNMSQAYIKLNQYKEAIESCEKALQIDPQHPKSLFRLAYAYYQTQQYTVCKETLEKLLSIAPENEEAQHLLTKVQTTNTMVDSKKDTHLVNGNNSSIPTQSPSVTLSSLTGTSSTVASESEPLLSTVSEKTNSKPKESSEINTSLSASARSSSSSSSFSHGDKDNDILRRAARKAFATSSTDKDTGAGLYADTKTYNTPLVSLKEREKNLEEYRNNSSWFGWLSNCARTVCCCGRRSKSKEL